MPSLNDEKVTYVMTYFDNPEMMKLHLGTWHTYPPRLRRRVQFIVVDDCSTVPLKVDEAVLNLTILRINDPITWNLPGARNLGAHYCKTDWFFMADTDMLITAENAQKILDLPRTNPNQIWGLKHRDATLHHRNGACDNHMLLSRELFWRCWGYSEDFSGSYGGQEGHLRSKLMREGGERSKDHFAYMINFGQDKSPVLINDAKSSTDEMKTEKGLERAREISGGLYHNSAETGPMRRKLWDKNVLRFDWEVSQEFIFEPEPHQQLSLEEDKWALLRRKL